MIHLFECVNVLCVVSEQGPVFLDAFDEPVTRRRLELSRINFPGKLEKGTRVLPEVVDVEHRLRVRQIRKVDGETRVDAIARPEIRNPARDGNSGSGEDDDLLGASDEIDHLVQRVDVRKLLSARWLADHVQDDLPESQLVEMFGNFGITGDQILNIGKICYGHNFFGVGAQN